MPLVLQQISYGADHRQARSGPVVRFWHVDGGVAVGGLRGVHRGIGMAQQRLAVRSVGWGECDSDAGVGAEHHVTIPAHKILKLGTLVGILDEVAVAVKLSRSDLEQELFAE